MGRKLPGGRGRYRLAMLGVAPGDCAVGYELRVLRLTNNDTMLGSGDAVP